MKRIISLPFTVTNQDELIDHFYTLDLVKFARPALSAQMKYTGHIPDEILDRVPNKDYVTYQDIHDLGEDPFAGKFLTDYLGTDPLGDLNTEPPTTGVSRTIHNEEITCDAIEDLKKQVLEIIPEIDIDEVVYIHNEKGSHTRTHVDYPIRKNCVFIFPLFGESRYKFPKTNATTFFRSVNQEYKIMTPCVLDVMKPHGVKDCDGERLLIQFEIGNLSYEEVYDILTSRYPEFYESDL